MRDATASVVVDAGDVEAILGDPRKITIVAQPIVDLHRAVVVGYELLSRFAIDKRVGPDKVFAAAMKAGRGAELEALVVDRALTVAETKPPNCFATINLDPLHLHAPELAAVGKQVRDLRAHAQVHAPVHHAGDAVPLLDREIAHVVQFAGHTRVVVREVEPPELGDRAGDHRVDRCGRGDVGLHEDRASAGCRREVDGLGAADLVDVGDHDGCARTREAERRGPADAAGRAGDDRDAAVEVVGDLTHAVAPPSIMNALPVIMCASSDAR